MNARAVNWATTRFWTDEVWVRIEPEEILDLRVNPLRDGWEARYRQSAIGRLKAAGLPPASRMFR